MENGGAPRTVPLRLFPVCFQVVSRLFPGCFPFVSRLFPGCFLDVSWMLTKCFPDVSGLFPGCFLRGEWSRGLVPARQTPQTDLARQIPRPQAPASGYWPPATRHSPPATRHSPLIHLPKNIPHQGTDEHYTRFPQNIKTLLDSLCMLIC